MPPSPSGEAALALSNGEKSVLFFLTRKSNVPTKQKFRQIYILQNFMLFKVTHLCRFQNMILGIMVFFFISVGKVKVVVFFPFSAPKVNDATRSNNCTVKGKRPKAK